MLANRAVLVAALVAAWQVAACGGGGGGPSGPDIDPPDSPRLDRIDVNPPVPTGVSTIIGTEGAVEGGATVTVVNVDATARAGGIAVRAQTVAVANGSFSTSIPAQLGDQLEVTATDAAGNESTAATVDAGPIPTTFTGTEAGAIQLFTFSSGEGAVSLPFATGQERYTLVAQALNPSGDPYPLEIAGNREVLVTERVVSPAGSFRGTPVGLESEIRELERRIMPTLPRAGAARTRRLAGAVALGAVDTFFVANRLGEISITNRGHFDDVVAELRFEGENSLIYIDVRTPPENVPDGVINEIGNRFDDEILPTNVAAFGAPSDVDGNGKVILLLTPTINALNTPEIVEGGSIFLGFFFGIDLLPDPVLNPFGNGSDIMYGVIPDPTGEFGAAKFPLEVTENLVLSVFAHELEHLISANEHVLVRGGSPEQTWLDEGLAHMAESLNGFVLQNRLRSGLFLDDPQNNPLVGGEDSLERRGAAWLFVQYMRDRFGPAILGALVQTRLTGIVNVDRAANWSFPFLFHEWASTLYLDDRGVTSDPVFSFPSLDLRAEFQLAKQRLDPGEIGTYLGLQTRTVGGQTGGPVSRDVHGTAATYYDLVPAAAGTFPVVVESSRAANLQVTIVRTE